MPNALKYVICYIALLLFGILWIASVIGVGELSLLWFSEPSQRAVIVLGYVGASVFAAVGSAVIVPRLWSTNKG